MKRYFILAGVAHQSKDGQWVKADECPEIIAKQDALLLVVPYANGGYASINLLGANMHESVKALHTRLLAEQKEDEE